MNAWELCVVGALCRSWSEQRRSHLKYLRHGAVGSACGKQIQNSCSVIPFVVPGQPKDPHFHKNRNEMTVERLTVFSVPEEVVQV